MIEVKAYGFSLAIDEVFYAMGTSKEKKLVQLVKNTKEFLGIHPTPDGSLQVFLFLTPDARNKAYERAKVIGFVSAAVILNPAFIDEKYIK